MFTFYQFPDDKSWLGDGFLKPADILLINNHNHPDTHIEDPVHLIPRDLAAFLDQSEKRRDCPGFRIDDCVHGPGKDTRDIFDEATPGQVRQSFDW